MSKEKTLVERKLGIINKIRKRFFLMNLSEKKVFKYSKLPEILKNDEEIITAVWSKNKEMLLSLPIGYQKKYIKEAPTHFFERYESDSNFLEVLGEIIIETILKEKKDMEELFKGIPFDKLLEKTQLKLMLIDNKYIEIASEEAISKFVGNNSLLIEKAPSNYVYSYMIAHPEKNCNFSQKFQTMKLHSSWAIEFRKEITDFKNMDELKKYLILKENNDYEVNIFDIKDDDYIWEMGKFKPELMYDGPDVCYNGKYKSQRMSHYYEITRRRSHIIQNVINHAKITEPEGEITKFLENYLGRVVKTSSFITTDTNKVNEIMKFLLNDKIATKVPQKEILEYIEDPTNNKLAEIVRKSYGNQAAKIIEDRPEITSKDIQNFYIFDEKIIEEFGIGAVHATLSYDMKAPAIFSEFARFPEKMQLFKEFRENMHGTFGNTAIDLEKELKAFINSEALIKNLNGKKLTEIQKEDLKLAIYDTFVFENSPIVPFPQNVEELNEYKEKRDKIYDECIEKLSNPDDIKDMISRKYLCMRYEKSNPEINSPAVLDMISFYNIQRDLDDEIIQSDRFSEDDLDALELLYIMSKIENPKILKELSKELGKNELIINPEHYKTLKKELPLLYSEKLIKELINPEKIEKMIEDGQEGISVREEEEIKIITLKGVDFISYISNPFLNNSYIKYMASLDDALNKWKNMENGISTFSGCLINGNRCSQEIADKNWNGNLGFFYIKPDQIYAMGEKDIGMSHDIKELNPRYGGGIRFENPEKIIENISEKGKNPWPYNEVASHRRTQDLEQITEDTYGGKIMPDFIYIYGVGKITPAIIETAKKHGIKYIFEYDYRAYEQKKEINLKKEHSKNTPRPQSEFMKKVNKIQETGDKDER